MNDEIEIEHVWVPPKDYDDIVLVENGTPLIDVYPDGMLVRITEGGVVVSVENATREEAET